MITINDKNDLIPNDMTFSFTETYFDSRTYCSSDLSKTNHHSKCCGFYTFVSSKLTREKTSSYRTHSMRPTKTNP